MHTSSRVERAVGPSRRPILDRSPRRTGRRRSASSRRHGDRAVSRRSSPARPDRAEPSLAGVAGRGVGHRRGRCRRAAPRLPLGGDVVGTPRCAALGRVAEHVRGRRHDGSRGTGSCAHRPGVHPNDSHGVAIDGDLTLAVGLGLLPHDARLSGRDDRSVDAHQTMIKVDLGPLQAADLTQPYSGSSAIRAARRRAVGSSSSVMTLASAVLASRLPPAPFGRPRSPSA